MKDLKEKNIQLQKENEQLKFRLKIAEAEVRRYIQDTFAMEEYRKLLNLYEKGIKELTSKIYYDEVFKN